MSLTETAVRNAKPREKPYKLSDEKGLYVQVNPNGSKLWHLKYRFADRETGWPSALSNRDTGHGARAADRSPAALRDKVDPGEIQEAGQACGESCCCEQL